MKDKEKEGIRVMWQCFEGGNLKLLEDFGSWTSIWVASVNMKNN